MTASELHEMEVLTQRWLDSRIGTFPKEDYNRLMELKEKKDKEEKERILMDISRRRVW